MDFWSRGGGKTLRVEPLKIPWKFAGIPWRVAEYVDGVEFILLRTGSEII